MRFFKLVTDYTESQDGTTAELAAGDLDRPFVELLGKQQLPSSIQAYSADPLGGSYSTYILL